MHKVTLIFIQLDATPHSAPYISTFISTVVLYSDKNIDLALDYIHAS